MAACARALCSTHLLLYCCVCLLSGAHPSADAQRGSHSAGAAAEDEEGEEQKEQKKQKRSPPATLQPRHPHPHKFGRSLQTCLASSSSLGTARPPSTAEKPGGTSTTHGAA